MDKMTEVTNIVKIKFRLDHFMFGWYEYEKGFSTEKILYSSYIIKKELKTLYYWR